MSKKTLPVFFTLAGAVHVVGVTDVTGRACAGVVVNAVHADGVGCTGVTCAFVDVLWDDHIISIIS